MDKKIYDLFSQETEVPVGVHESVMNALKEIEMDSEKSAGREEDKHDRQLSFGRKAAWGSFRKGVAAAVVMLVVTGSTVYAVGNHFRLFEFMKRNRIETGEEAEIVTDVDVSGTTNADGIVSYQVTEALYDNQSVYITVDVRAADTEKYLLVPQDAMKEDNVSIMGINADKTIGELSEEKNAELLYVGVGFDFAKEMGMDSYSCDYLYQEDGTLTVFVYGKTKYDAGGMKVACVGTAYGEKAKSAADVHRSEFSFVLQEK